MSTITGLKFQKSHSFQMNDNQNRYYIVPKSKVEGLRLNLSYQNKEMIKKNHIVEKLGKDLKPIIEVRLLNLFLNI